MTTKQLTNRQLSYLKRLYEGRLKLIDAEIRGRRLRNKPYSSVNKKYLKTVKT